MNYSVYSIYSFWENPYEIIQKKKLQLFPIYFVNSVMCSFICSHLNLHTVWNHWNSQLYPLFNEHKLMSNF